MFTQNSYYIGAYEVISIRNKQGVGIDFIPKKGGAIHQLYLGKLGIPILTPFVEGDDIKYNPACKQALLFPFPNRLEDGTYTHDQKEYHFPINEKDRNNALHGFLLNEELEVDEVTTKEGEIKIELSLTYKGQYSFYPFPCELKITYIVSENLFQLHFQVENTGKSSLPYGFGWHPYFLFNEQPNISMPRAFEQLVDERLLPTGEEIFFDDLLAYTTVKRHFDTCFRFEKTHPSTIKIGSENGHQLKISSDDSMDYVQIYTPSPTIIAVEPLSCNINALRNKNGINSLAPSQTTTHKINVSLS